MPVVTRSSFARLLLLCLHFGIACCLTTSQQLLAQVPPPAETDSASRQISFVTEKLQDWRNSFQSIRVTTHQTRTTSSRRRPLRPGTVNLPLPTPVVQEDTTTLWYENRFRFHSQTESFVASKLTYRRRSAVDEFRYWIAISSPDDPNQFESITLMPLQPVASPKIKFSSVHPLQHQAASRILDGLWHNAECCWISEWIHRTERIESAGRDNVNGRTCIVLEITLGSTSEVASTRTSKWWFDLEAGCLPVRKEWSNQADAAESDAQPQRDVWEVTELEEVRPGFWFPRSGTIRYQRANPAGDGMQTFTEPWRVDSIVLDETIPAELLIVPPGTSLTKTYVNDFQPIAPPLLAENPDSPAEVTPGKKDQESPTIPATARKWRLSANIVSTIFAVGALPILVLAVRSIQRRRIRKAH